MSAVARRYYVRGRRSLDVNDADGAMESFRSALEVAPNFSSARVGYAVALAKFGDCPRAAQTLRAGLARPATAVAKAAMWATLGDVLTTAGDFFGAEDAFRQRAVQPGFEVRSAAGLARVYGKLGRYQDSVAQLRFAASLSSSAATTTE